MLEIRGLTKKYGDFAALSELDAHVAAGEIVGLVGPNGAGKTTTLRCVTGIIPPTAGEIVIGGFDLAKQPVEAKRQFAFVADEPRLFEHLTVTDHMRVMARIYGVDDAETRASTLLEELELGDRLHSYPSELSRGMKQKLLVAMALLHHPKLLLLDEPLTGLDPGAMRRMKDRVVDVAKQGTAVILSSHMLHLVEALCDRILVLQGGKKILEGSLDEIRSSIPNLDKDADLEDVFLHATQDATEE